MTTLIFKNAANKSLEMTALSVPFINLAWWIAAQAIALSGIFGSRDFS